MKVLLPSRIVGRHVGGNTTYARKLYEELPGLGVEVGLLPAARNPVATSLLESFAGQRHLPDTVIHYSADTGSLIHTRTPSVVTVHGVASRWIDVARTARQESVWRFRVSRAIASSHRVITVSEAAARDVEEVFHVKPELITVIPHGVDFEKHARRATLSDEASALLPRHFCLYVGNLEPRKNLVALIDAFDKSPLATLGIPLVLAGRPAWNYDEILRRIETSPNVVYLGFVSESDRIALMQRTRLFVFPSLYEGFGMPVIEAMAAGAPVAASRRGSLEEVAGPAWDLDDLTSDGLANSIASALLDSDWLATAPTAGGAWASQFTWTDSISAHVNVYRAVAGS